MREIKFRAWDSHHKEMHYEMGFHLDENVLELSKLIEDGRWILQQYTGLKDKNGKEIFEGDIVKDNEGAVRRIKWENGSFWARESIVGHLASMIDDKIMYDPEVIGNIYENPELIN
jgi:hypothetical protein